MLKVAGGFGWEGGMLVLARKPAGIWPVDKLGVADEGPSASAGGRGGEAERWWCSCTRDRSFDSRPRGDGGDGEGVASQRERWTKGGVPAGLRRMARLCRRVGWWDGVGGRQSVPNGSNGDNSNGITRR